MRELSKDVDGSAVRWFALAACALCMASLAGAHALDWLSQSGRVALVTYRPPAQASAAVSRIAADAGIDPTPTGSIPSAAAPSSAVMIRLR